MITPISFLDLKPFLDQAKKEMLTFCDNVEYFGYYNEDKIVAFCGIRYVGSKKAIVKNYFVVKEHRGKGYFKILFEYSLSFTQGKTIEATCTPMSINLFLKKGFKVIKEYKNGCKTVWYENI